MWTVSPCTGLVLGQVMDNMSGHRLTQTYDKTLSRLYMSGVVRSFVTLLV